MLLADEFVEVPRPHSHRQRLDALEVSAAGIVKDTRLDTMSKQMMEIGDKWRNISYFAAKIGKHRDLGSDRMKELSRMIHSQADAEQKFFSELYQLVK